MPMTDENIPDRPLAIVTGASSGIGRELAFKAALRGYRLLLVSRNEFALKELQRSLRTRADILALDLKEESSIDRILSWLSEREITPELLINNAGFGAFGEAVDMNSDMLLSMIRLNVEAVTMLSVKIGRRMAAAGRGHILNVASTAAFQACPNLAVYGATKAYVLSLSEALHEELKPRGITVTALCPGPTRTNFGINAGLEKDSPFDRWATEPENVARTGFNAMMRGEAFVVDGVLNKVVAFGAQIAPRSWAAAIAGRLLKKMK